MWHIPTSVVELALRGKSGPVQARPRTRVNLRKGAIAMTPNLREMLSELSAEAPIDCERLRFIPLRPKRTSDLEYLTLDESSAALVTIEESSPSGSVHELRVRNSAKKLVFIPDGSTLTGAKQNRVVNMSVMVAPESATLIPVSCVERGRWQHQSPYFERGPLADGCLRARMCHGATDSLKRTGKILVDQGTVWSHVEAMLATAGADSPTRAYHALYEQQRLKLANYKARFHLPKDACGVAAVIDGALETVDLFDKPNTLHQLWPRLLASYALATLRPEATGSTRTDVKEFIDRVVSSPGESYVTVGAGTTVRLTNSDAVGAALICNGRLIHLSVFANGMSKGDGGQLSQLANPQRQPSREPKPSDRPRPWWRFWA